MKQVKLWKVWRKFDYKTKAYAYVVESFDAIEQPTRYKLLNSNTEAFGFHTYIEKAHAHLTREQALEVAIKQLSDSVEDAKQQVIDAENFLKQVKTL